MKPHLMFVTALLTVGACSKSAPAPVYQAIAVERRDVIVSARAAGQIQPDTVVEVKSKASGEILDMRAETGQLVARGELLVKVDPRTARNRFNESEANLTVAKARLTNAESKKRRADELFKTQSITQEEHENAILELANAQAAVVGAEVAVENAQIALEDTDVRAPIGGTIISKTVERGQVISSPTSDVGGGTVLLQMADLDLVQVRTLVDETDIGKIKAGLEATVRVDAYPNQPFNGEVLKIEPLAETSQNVTMFPVIIRIENRNGLLKPGMNSDVEIHVGRRDAVLAVPNAALRTARDVSSAAMVLGMSEEELQAGLEAANAVRDSARSGARLAGGGDTTGRRPSPPVNGGGETPANVFTTPDGRSIPLPEGVTEAKIRELMQKRFGGGQLSSEEQALLTRVTGALGGGRGGFGGPGGGNRRPRTQNNDFQFGGDYIVFALRNGKPTPVHVRTGLTDLDWSEVTSGLTESDSVLVLPSASLVQQQQEYKERINRMTGGGAVPGMSQQTPAAGTRPR